MDFLTCKSHFVHIVCKSFALLFGFPYVARRASQLAMK
jgi:hypothetical protein